MPTPTPNRAYPYPDPADPADVAGALQALAEAIDADLATIAPTIVHRRVARVARSSSVNFGTTATTADINWESLVFNENGAVATFPEAPAYRVTPAEPGLWVVVGQVSWREIGGPIPNSRPVQYVDVDIAFNGTRIARQSSPNRDTGAGVGDNRTLCVGGARLMNGTTDYFQMASSIIRPAINPNAPFSIFGASMTLWQMTLS